MEDVLRFEMGQQRDNEFPFMSPVSCFGIGEILQVTTKLGLFGIGPFLLRTAPLKYVHR